MYGSSCMFILCGIVCVATAAHLSSMTAWQQLHVSMIANSCYQTQDICSYLCYVNAPSMLMICMYACNYYQQPTQMGHLCSLGICSPILLGIWSWIHPQLKELVQQKYNIIQISAYKQKLNQYLPPKTLCHCLGLTWLHKNYCWTLINKYLFISYMQSTLYQWKPLSLQNWLLASNGSQWHQKRTGYKPGLDVSSRHILCYKSAPTV